ncbi:MAG: hypothetical protein U0V56_04005 [Actinomycetota bacterium]
MTDEVDEPDVPDADEASELLDGIPGALERANEGLSDARSGRTVPLSGLDRLAY